MSETDFQRQNPFCHHLIFSIFIRFMIKFYATFIYLLIHFIDSYNVCVVVVVFRVQSLTLQAVTYYTSNFIPLPQPHIKTHKHFQRHKFTSNARHIRDFLFAGTQFLFAEIYCINTAHFA